MRKRHYDNYNDGLPVVEIAPSGMKALNKNVCIVGCYRTGTGKKIHIRIRQKPLKKLSTVQELHLLRKKVRMYERERQVSI